MAGFKIVYKYHPVSGIYVGQDHADESPLEPGVFLIPASATTKVPLSPKDGKYVVFVNGDWQYKDIPPPPKPEEPNPQPEPQPPADAESCSARQFKLQLYFMGILDEVENWVETKDRPIQIAFEYSATFVKNDPMMQLGFSELGFTPEQMTQFFNAASRL